ncbi:hypothetical protein [Holospora obtusa]|uniref:hypothetical protein n=1 Tax=Holospora obtusa TaxID=49893 RepID=UPI0012EB89AF|nr:hypothetical protein [Holospora obtusa]
MNNVFAGNEKQFPQDKKSPRPLITQAQSDVEDSEPAIFQAESEWIISDQVASQNKLYSKHPEPVITQTHSDLEGEEPKIVKKVKKNAVSFEKFLEIPVHKLLLSLIQSSTVENLKLQFDSENFKKEKKEVIDEFLSLSEEEKEKFINFLMINKYYPSNQAPKNINTHTKFKEFEKNHQWIQNQIQIMNMSGNQDMLPHALSELFIALKSYIKK